MYVCYRTNINATVRISFFRTGLKIFNLYRLQSYFNWRE